MAQAKYSFYDTGGKACIDCSECKRGGNGNTTDDEECSCGARITKGNKGYCFCGELMDGLEIPK